ncbi:MAG: polyprenyl diphosphate synthase [Patescibacteria group bacterium]
MAFQESHQPKIPVHVGIILDGNRRWAKAHGLSTLAGHRRGYDNVKKIAAAAFKQGVKILTVYAFSTENWRREKAEVDYLLGLFRMFVGIEIKDLTEQGVRINFFGRRADFAKSLQSGMRRVEAETRDNQAGTLNICLSYGGRDEIVRSIKKVIRAGKRNGQISEELISANLDSAGQPDPDLIIRTSGEERLSGFLTWQSVYSELYFTRKHWPDFNSRDLDKALKEYSRRKRRYGK